MCEHVIVHFFLDPETRQEKKELIHMVVDRRSDAQQFEKLSQHTYARLHIGVNHAKSRRPSVEVSLACADL